LPDDIDHLVFTAPTLESGIAIIENLLGVKAVRGGSHPDYGTHNALLSLGDSTYLEIIAPDPGLIEPEYRRLFQDSYYDEPKLTTWALRTEHIEELQAEANKNGLNLGAVRAGSREKPDGTVLSWKLTDPYAMPFDGAIPFLINWGNTQHPSTMAPYAGELIALTIEHPHPEQLKEKFQLLNIEVKVNKGQKMKLMATIRTNSGTVILE